MHGLITTAFQRFAVDTYGATFWADVVRDAGLDLTQFEPLVTYAATAGEATAGEAVLAAMAGALQRSPDAVLEDLGTYLVSHPNSGRIRRLLRFCGAGFEDFLHSLDELPDRIRLAVPGLDVPRLDLRSAGPGRFTLTCGPPPGFGHLMVGILRAMADDYGALVTLDHRGASQGQERIEIALVLSGYAQGRQFDLGARTG